MNLAELLIQLGDKTVLIDYEDYPINDLTVADVTRDGIGSSITEEVYREIKVHISESKEISKEAFLVAIVASSIKNDNLLRSEIFKQLSSADGHTIRESFSNMLKWPTSPLHFEEVAPFLNYNADSFYQSGIRHSAMLLLSKVTEKDKAFSALETLYCKTKNDREKESVVLVLTKIGDERSIQFIKNTVQDKSIFYRYLDTSLAFMVSNLPDCHEWICNFIPTLKDERGLMYVNDYRLNQTFLEICKTKNKLFSSLTLARMTALMQVKNRLRQQKMYTRLTRTDQVETLQMLNYFEGIGTPTVVSQIFNGQELSNLEQQWVDKHIKLNPR